jgi:methionyl-tRNA formyltransferase
MKKEDLRIVFMGTPEFAVTSLKMLHKSGHNVVGVITAPDRPSGRGRKIATSPVKDFALANGLKLFQPTNLKEENFIATLSALNANLQIVVAFRMLPKVVWDMPELGTFNLHASLLPQYRGAAPINHVIINGEKKTGLTTFFIDEKIDTGRIIKQEEMEIREQETFGELHDRMKEKGAALIIQTIDLILSKKVTAVKQSFFIDSDKQLKSAPKIFKEDCRIDWSKSAEKINNLVRGLCPSPSAFAILTCNDEKDRIVKIFRGSADISTANEVFGKIFTDNKTYLKVTTCDGYFNILELQMEGKKKTNILEFLRGNKISKNATFN